MTRLKYEPEKNDLRRLNYHLILLRLLLSEDEVSVKRRYLEDIARHNKQPVFLLMASLVKELGISGETIKERVLYDWQPLVDLMEIAWPLNPSEL